MPTPNPAVDEIVDCDVILSNLRTAKARLRRLSLESPIPARRAAARTAMIKLETATRAVEEALR